MAEAISIDDRATRVVSRPRGRPRTMLARAPGGARRVVSNSSAVIPEALLGTGGMGVVYLARQPALARSVALKSVAPEHHADAALTGALVREAQVTGALEHPNIVPVYDIRRDEAGRPQIILRKIEGLEWGVLMEDAAELARRFDVGDPLEWHLRVLIQVCNGISFAHSRGVLHRDLKPENVMIGAFGEVYILDWGIAAGVVGTEGAALCGPPVEGEVAGTPGYMAPEMLEGDASQQSPRTDVYLLGGLLHEILVGEPPHVGDSLTEVVERTLAGVTDLPVDTPPTLARLCARALARDPDDRPESAAAFRRALERYLRTRHVDRLMAEANARLAALERALARGGARGQDDHAIYNLFGQCRFGFQLALAASPGDKTARVGSRRAVEAMVRHELQRDNAAAAAAFASGVELSSELRARIDAQLAQAQEQRGRLSLLQALAREHDPSAGMRARRLVAWSLASLWIMSPLLLSQLGAREVGLGFVGLALALLVAIVAALWLARGAIRRTAINRRAAGAFLYLGVGVLLSALAMSLSGASASALAVHSLFVAFSAAAVLAIAVDRRLLITALTCAVAYVLASALPELRFAMISLVGLGFLVNVEAIWRAPSTSGARA